MIQQETIGVATKTDALTGVHFDNFIFVTTGVDNLDGGSVGAQLNWWGCSGGPTAPGMRGCQRYEPHLHALADITLLTRSPLLTCLQLQHQRHLFVGTGLRWPSWLTFIGHLKDSLWSMDLFRCESATLRTHWVLVVMDQYTRRIIGFGVHAGTVDGVALCRMFNRAIRGHRSMPKYLSSDHDPLYRFEQWQANLRILEVTEIKTVPYVPLSHPFVERLIGTIRREYLDRTLFWTTADLENKLLDFRTYFNDHRTHDSLEGRTPDTPVSRPIANLRSIRWQPHCRGLYQTPVAA